MDIRKDQRGFSLVELIITIAIMAVFAGAIIGGLTYLNAGKTKKASAKLNNEISSIQTATMTKKGETYLYLYRTNDGVFSSIVSSTYDADNDGTPDFPDGFMNRADLNTYLTNGGSQTKICDSTVSIKGKVGTGTGADPMSLDTTNMLKIGYSKGTGAFTYCNNGTLDSGKAMIEMPFYSMIEMSGKEKFTIQLVKATGKHFIKQG